jgi:transposase-like protein
MFNRHMLAYKALSYTMSNLLVMPLSLPSNGSQEYKCKMCGKKFRDSLGDMQRHILTEHMQRADFSILKNKIIPTV